MQQCPPVVGHKPRWWQSRGSRGLTQQCWGRAGLSSGCCWLWLPALSTGLNNGLPRGRSTQSLYPAHPRTLCWHSWPQGVPVPAASHATRLG